MSEYAKTNIKKRAQKKAQNTFRDPFIGTLRNPV